MHKIGNIKGNCKIVVFYNIVPIHYSRFVSSIKYVGLINHFNNLCASINHDKKQRQENILGLL